MRKLQKEYEILLMRTTQENSEIQVEAVGEQPCKYGYGERCVLTYDKLKMNGDTYVWDECTYDKVKLTSERES